MHTEALTMIFIFFARILDVSIGTLRIILISRGYRYFAPLLGFMEILIWLIAISTALKNLNTVYSYLIYAGGFAVGNYVGMLLEAKISLGYQSIRVITSKEVSALPLQLREEGFGITSVEGMGLRGSVYILYSVIPKRDVKKFLQIVNILEPDAFVTIEEVRSKEAGFVSRKTFPNFFGRRVVKKK